MMLARKPVESMTVAGTGKALAMNMGAGQHEARWAVGHRAVWSRHMGFLDKARETAQQAATKAQQGIAQGQAKLDEVQTARAWDKLLRDLGTSCYAEQRSGGPHQAVVAALSALDAHVAANGPLGQAGAGSSAPQSPADPSAPAGSPSAAPPAGSPSAGPPTPGGHTHNDL